MNNMSLCNNMFYCANFLCVWCLSDNFEEVELKLLEQVKAVFEYGNNDWYRVYLLRALNRHAGMDCLQALISSTDYEWIFPAEILRLHVRPFK